MSGADILDLGADGGVAVGDHNTSGSAIGAGDDEITGGSADDILVGDSAAGGTVTDAGDDELESRGGNDRLFGDNVNFAGTMTIGTVGGDDRLEGDTGDDALFGGPANDSLNGGANTDSCDGEDGTDNLGQVRDGERVALAHVACGDGARARFDRATTGGRRPLTRYSLGGQPIIAILDCTVGSLGIAAVLC
jgi:Ca2+-binding RTX toxin-like protein